MAFVDGVDIGDAVQEIQQAISLGITGGAGQLAAATDAISVQEAVTSLDIRENLNTSTSSQQLWANP